MLVIRVFYLYVQLNALTLLVPAYFLFPAINFRQLAAEAS
jgi:hypothetical protein